MKYSIMHVNDRAKENMDYNKEILKDFEYCKVEYFDGNLGNGWDIINHMQIPVDRWNPYDGRTFAPLPGEYGVWVSNIYFLQYMIDNSIDRMLLLEDDILLDKNFVYNFNLCVNELPEDFDFLSLYSFDGQNDLDENTDIGAQYIHRSHNQYSAGQATVFSLQGAKKILKVLKRKGIEYTSDCFYFKQSQLGVINGYSVQKEKVKFLDHEYKKIKSLIDPENVRNTWLDE
jgi:GR25 family glycosyltransferase involved in LPS biosynthesis